LTAGVNYRTEKASSLARIWILVLPPQLLPIARATALTTKEKATKEDRQKPTRDLEIHGHDHLVAIKQKNQLSA
jgi:hypothetical protein